MPPINLLNSKNQSKAKQNVFNFNRFYNHQIQINRKESLKYATAK